MSNTMCSKTEDSDDQQHELGHKMYKYHNDGQNTNNGQNTVQNQ